MFIFRNCRSLLAVGLYLRPAFIWINTFCGFSSLDSYSSQCCDAVPPPPHYHRCATIAAPPSRLGNCYFWTWNQCKEYVSEPQGIGPRYRSMYVVCVVGAQQPCDWRINDFKLNFSLGKYWLNRAEMWSASQSFSIPGRVRAANVLCIHYVWD